MTIGSYTDVDTTMFRVAVMHYIQCLFGIRHDDYDYGQINELLARYVLCSANFSLRGCVNPVSGCSQPLACISYNLMPRNLLIKVCLSQRVVCTH